MAVFIILQVFWYELLDSCAIILNISVMCMWLSVKVNLLASPVPILLCKMMAAVCMKYWWSQSSSPFACVSNPETRQKLHQDVFPCRALRPYAVLAVLCVLKTLYLCFLERTRGCMRSSVSLVCLSANYLVRPSSNLLKARMGKLNPWL